MGESSKRTEGRALYSYLVYNRVIPLQRCVYPIIFQNFISRAQVHGQRGEERTDRLRLRKVSVMRYRSDLLKS